MFDIGFWEVAFIGLLALLILGPSRLPEAARSAGQWIGKLRVFISNVKNDLDNQLQSDELAELRRLKNELVQAREVIQQTSGEMLSSFTDGIDAQVQEISGQSDSSKMDFIDDAVSAPRVSKPFKPKRKSGKTTVVKKGKNKKRPATKKTKTTNKKLTSKKSGKKKTNKKTGSSKKIAKTKSRKNGR